MVTFFMAAAEKALAAGQPKRGFGDMFELSMRFLANPWKLWASGHLELRRLVLRLGFRDRLAYVRGEGFRTPEFSSPFKALEAFNIAKSEMAHRGGQPRRSVFKRM